MSTTFQQMRRAAIRETLARRAGPTADSGGVALATFQTWRQMAERVEPVIGARGVEILFGRALHLTTKVFPWLVTAGAHGVGAAFLASLQTCFAAQELLIASDAGSALLTMFADLLANLVGDSLTERLLGVVWSSPKQVRDQESQS